MGLVGVLSCQDRVVESPLGGVAPRQESVRQGPALVDARNGRSYPTVLVGSQRWMAANLDFDTLDTVSSWCPDGGSSRCAPAGRLYGWRAATRTDSSVRNQCDVWPDSVGICPKGWHLPSLAELRELVDSVGGPDQAGQILKSDTGWRRRPDGSPGSGSDAVGFSALPQGIRFAGDQGYGKFGHTPADAAYLDRGESAAFWSRTHDVQGSCWSAWGLFLSSQRNLAEFLAVPRSTGLSIRCVEDR